MLPGFYSSVIINSAAFLGAPHSDPSSSSCRTSHPCRQGAADCGSEKTFPTHTSTAPSQHYSALNSSQTAAQNSKQELEQHFIHFLYPLVLYLSESKTKTSPKGFHPQTPQWKLRALSHCFRLTVSSNSGRNRGRIHHWALQGMVNLLETESLWAETHKISSATQNCRSRCVTNVNR